TERKKMKPAQILNKIWPYFILFLFVTLVYFPIVFQFFALKNDALTDNFPQKFFFSKLLRSGIFPLWNPFINHGIPLYADPGFAYWQPITWLFGLMGYSVGSLAVESVLYIFIGGCTCYHLGKALRLNNNV